MHSKRALHCFRVAAEIGARVASVAAAIACAFLAIAAAPAGAATAEHPVVDPREHPLANVPKGRSTTEQVLRFPAWVAERPFWAMGRGLEGSLTWVEQKGIVHKVGKLPAWLVRNHLILGLTEQGTGAGTGLMGGTFARVGPGMVIATTDWTLREYQAHALELRMPLSRSVGVRAFGRFDRRTRDSFYGIGPDSREHDRTQYHLESVSTGLALGWRAGRGWTVRGEGGWVDYDAVENPEGDEHPSTLDVFPALPGSGGPDLLSGGVTTERFTRDSGIAAGFHAYHETDGHPYDFRRYDLTLLRTVPVFWGDRTLTLRFHGAMTDPSDGSTVPFWLLPELSTRTGLRAYDAWRFRDLDVVVMNAEYRFPIWDIGMSNGAAIETVLFFDAGRVSPAIEDDLIWREFKSDAGFAFRLRTARSMIGRVNFAFAADEIRVELQTGHDF